MVAWSVLVGVLGVVGTWCGMVRLARTDPDRTADVFWALGLAALLPAWLVVFVALLDRLDGRRPDMSVAVWWILSAAAAICGVIVSHARIRGLQRAGEVLRPRTSWLAGVGAFLPSWAIAALGLALVAVRRP